MRLFEVKLSTALGSVAVYYVAKPTIREALDRAVHNYQLLNNGADVRVEAIKDVGNVLL